MKIIGLFKTNFVTKLPDIKGVQLSFQRGKNFSCHRGCQVSKEEKKFSWPSWLSTCHVLYHLHHSYQRVQNSLRIPYVLTMSMFYKRLQNEGRGCEKGGGRFVGLGTGSTWRQEQDYSWLRLVVSTIGTMATGSPRTVRSSAENRSGRKCVRR